MSLSRMRLAQVAIRAVLAASLILLHAYPPQAATPRQDGPSQIGYSAEAVLCSAAQDGKAPAQNPSGRSHRCFLCSQGHDRHIGGVDLPPDVLRIPVPDCATHFWRLTPTSVTRAMGWSSAWSSRSPPLHIS
jgi:hypothetical protein